MLCFTNSHPLIDLCLPHQLSIYSHPLPHSLTTRSLLPPPLSHFVLTLSQACVAMAMAYKLFILVAFALLAISMAEDKVS